MKDKNGNINCNGCQDCHNSTWCYNSTWCDNSTECYNSTWCHNSTGCHNSTWCNNSAYLLYCHNQVLEKYRIFNKKVTEKQYKEIKAKIQNQLGYYKHPKNLTKKDIDWLKKEIKQFDQKVLNKIIAESTLPDKPKEVGDKKE